HLWEENPQDANSMFFGYLLLKPKYDHISDTIREENRKQNKYDFSKVAVINLFKKEYASEIQKAVSNQLAYHDITKVAEIEPDILVTAFLLVPLRTTDATHKKFLRDITTALISVLKNNNREKRLDYAFIQSFLRKFAYFVLTSKKEDIESYIQPFIELIGDFRGTDDAA